MSAKTWWSGKRIKLIDLIQSRGQALETWFFVGMILDKLGVKWYCSKSENSVVRRKGVYKTDGYVILCETLNHKVISTIERVAPLVPTIVIIEGELGKDIEGQKKALKVSYTNIRFISLNEKSESLLASKIRRLNFKAEETQTLGVSAVPVTQDWKRSYVWVIMESDGDPNILRDTAEIIRGFGASFVSTLHQNGLKQIRTRGKHKPDIVVLFAVTLGNEEIQFIQRATPHLTVVAIPTHKMPTTRRRTLLKAFPNLRICEVEGHPSSWGNPLAKVFDKSSR